MATALYRRYRPETFAQMIGQAQVTEPLMTALRTNRVGQAYLFSGPRGCGKTTSARILARCLNCRQGPTDTPCGLCPSCVELGRDGHGSLDVVEIDAASHNGVDDAREIRERAVFAPSRDRYKIFILDEAHMVTPQGFNALLKIVEEPPEHVVFLFATTEPDKVIGTIRSRTHHYPFRLVPPAPMIDYIQSICDEEGITVAPGVLPLVARAGGGSPRDTLSLLDQLIAGSEGHTVEYERAVSLLGYTPAALLDEVVSALARRDGAGAFGVVDRVIQTGQDPRRFVEDLLERLRDLIVVTATTVEKAESVMHGIPRDELDRIAAQASRFGPAELSRSADIVHAALSAMTGATSPRMHLELLMARLLVPPAGATARDVVARLERVERRLDIDVAVLADVSGGVGAAGARPPAGPPPSEVAEPAGVVQASTIDAPAGSPSAVAAGSPVSAAGASSGEASAGRPVDVDPSTVTVGQVRDAWPQVLQAVQKARMSAWMVLQSAQVQELRDGPVLVLSFPSRRDVQALKDAGSAGHGVGDYLKDALAGVLGIRPALVAKTDASAAPASPEHPGGSAPAGDPAHAGPAVSWEVVPIPTPGAVETEGTRVGTSAAAAGAGARGTSPDTETPASGGPAAAGGRTPVEDDPAEEPIAEEPEDEEPEDEAIVEESTDGPAGGDEEPLGAAEPAAVSDGVQPRFTPLAAAPSRPAPDRRQRYGEAVVREVLGARFIGEQSLEAGE